MRRKKDVGYTVTEKKVRCAYDRALGGRSLPLHVSERIYIPLVKRAFRVREGETWKGAPHPDEKPLVPRGLHG